MFRLTAFIISVLLSFSLPAVQRYQSPVASADWNVNSSPVLCEMIHAIDHYGESRFVYASGGELAFQIRVLRAPTKDGVASLYSVAPYWREQGESQIAHLTFSRGKMPVYVGGDLAQQILNELEAGHHPTLHYKDWATYKNDVVVTISSVNFHAKLDEFQQCIANALPYGPERLKDTVVHFNNNEYVLQEAQLRKLRDIVLFAQVDRDMQIELHGHTDARGRRAYNQQLAEKRARAVEQYLLEQGVSASQVSRRAYGERQPIATNRTPQGRAKNRRVNILLARD